MLSFLQRICQSQKIIAPPPSHLSPSLSQINSRETLNMAPGRRVTERMGQLVAWMARGRPRPSPLPGWVGGIWRPRQGPLWCDTHTERRTEGLEPPRLGPRSPWETSCHQASDRGGVVCMFVCVWSHLGTPPPSWEHRPLPATTSPWWLRCCLCSSKLERFTSACTHNTCTYTEPTGGRPRSAQQAHSKG